MSATRIFFGSVLFIGKTLPPIRKVHPQARTSQARASFHLQLDVQLNRDIPLLAFPVELPQTMSARVGEAMKKQLIALAAAGVLTMTACSTTSDDADNGVSASPTDAVSTSEDTPSPSQPTQSTDPDEETSTNEPSPSATEDLSLPDKDDPDANTHRQEFVTGPLASSDTLAADGQALPIAVRFGEHDGFDRVVIEYDDPHGSMEWSTEGWTDKAYEDGSGFEIETGTERQLQVWVAGVRYPFDAGDDDILVTGLFKNDGGIEVAHVSGMFEGQHSVTIGASEDRPYRVFSLVNPARIVIDVESAN